MCRKKQKGCTLWFTGLSGAGKSTLAEALCQALHERGYHVYVLDSDAVRSNLCCDLNFSDEDRRENIRRVSAVTRMFVDAEVFTIASFISPFQKERLKVRKLFAQNEFFEFYVNTPLSVCEQRDPKSLYKKARAGEIPFFTGIDSPYETPESPDLILDTLSAPPHILVKTILSFLQQKQIIAS